MIKTTGISIDYNAMLWLIKNLPLIEGYINNIYGDTSVDYWMHGPHPELQYNSPHDVLMDGGFGRLDELVRGLYESYNVVVNEERKNDGYRG